MVFSVARLSTDFCEDHLSSFHVTMLTNKLTNTDENVACLAEVLIDRYFWWLPISRKVEHQLNVSTLHCWQTHKRCDGRSINVHRTGWLHEILKPFDEISDNWWM